MNLFRDVPIKRKLMLGALASSTAALLLASATYYAYERAAFHEDAVRTLTILADVLAANSTAALSLADASDTSADAEEILGALNAEPDILSAALYSTDGKLFARFVRGGAEDPPAHVPVRMESPVSGDRITVQRPVLLGEKRLGTISIVSNTDRIHSRLRRYLMIGGAVLLASLLLAALLAAKFQRVVSGPIIELADAARRVADRKDYSVRAQRFGGDELGLLTDDFNQMLAAIEQQSCELGNANRSLQAQAAQITESVEVLGAAARDILTFTTQAASTASETATAVTETTATVEEVRRTVHTTNEKARDVADIAKKSAQISDAGRKSTDASVAGMNHIRQQMEAIAESMVQLSDQTQTIAQVVAVVEDLAAQSNLLAVNAAIEAAKAGEHGKGFAVVSQEVRSLAEQSRQATSRVRAILKDVQKATSAAVLATEQGSKAVDAGVNQSAQAGESIATLSESVKQAAQAASQIAASSQQQLVGMEQVALAIVSIKKASTENVDSAKQLEAAARNLSDLGQKLRQLVGQFKT